MSDKPWNAVHHEDSAADPWAPLHHEADHDEGKSKSKSESKVPVSKSSPDAQDMTQVIAALTKAQRDHTKALVKLTATIADSALGLSHALTAINEAMTALNKPATLDPS